jgi:hypothetical protein
VLRALQWLHRRRDLAEDHTALLTTDGTVVKVRLDQAERFSPDRAAPVWRPASCLSNPLGED